MKCHQCDFNGLKYLQENHNKHLKGKFKGEWKRDNFTARCKKCGWGGDVRVIGTASTRKDLLRVGLKGAEVNINY